MLLKTILNRVHPIKCFVYTRVKFEESPVLAITVEIKSRKNGKGKCSICGLECPGYDRLPQREFEFIPLWNIPLLLLYSLRRVSCKEHGVVVEQIPWAKGKEHTATAFQIFLSQWARLLSWKEVALRFRTSWDVVYFSIKRVVDYGLEHRDLSSIESVGVDEIAIWKGHKYATMVYQIDETKKRLLWIGKDRTVRTLLRFFMDFGKERTQSIKFVCSDMWKPYLKVIAKKIPNALNILDRFHIMKKFNGALDQVRSTETGKLLREGKEPVLTKTKWLLLKRPENLTDKQNGHLKNLLQYNLQSVRAYLLREDFQHFWSYTSMTWASKFLDEWIRRTMLSRIEPLKQVAKMLKKHKPLIMNWFIVKGKLSSGVVEALNNNAKVTIRKSYGFRQYETLKYALYHKLGNLPLPECTHKFF
jgi:transposase